MSTGNGNPQNGMPRRVAFDLRNRRSVILVSLLLFELVVWVFLPSLQGEFLIYDEYGYVTGNSHVNSGLSWTNFVWAFSSLFAANWHPLTWLSHMTDVEFYGMNPWGHHLTSMLLHAFNTVLIFLVFRRMTGAGWRSLVVAGLFGLHPLRVESVAWISERKDVLSTMFWLLAMWTYTRFAEETRKQDGKSKLFYCLTLVFFAMGLMSKTMLVTLPCVFLLLDYWPLNRWKQDGKWRLVVEKAPFLLLALAVSVIEYIAQKQSGAMEEMVKLSLGARFENALISYVRYLGKFFWPENLCIYYPHPGHWPAIGVLLSTLFLLGALVLVWTMHQRQPWLLLGWFWYLGTLVPVIGLLQLGSASMADRYTYVPLIGIYVLLVWELHDLTKQWRYQALMAGLGGAVALSVCVALTRYEIGFWKDGVTVWSRAIALTKDNYVAHHNLGVLLNPTQPDAALDEFREAVHENPDFADAQRYLAASLFNKGRVDEAIAHLQKSLQIDPASEWSERSLGIAFSQNKQWEQAVFHFQKAAEYDPTNATTQNGLGLALLNLGRLDEAALHLLKAVQYQPDNVDTHSRLAVIYYRQGQLKGAITQFQMVAEHEPTNAIAQNDLGAALLKNEQWDEAIPKFQEALRLVPDYAAARKNLDLALAFRARTMTQTNQPQQ
jgi:Flp pilus assembly protein TadD